MTPSRDALILAASMEIGDDVKAEDRRFNGAIASAAYRVGYWIGPENCADILEEVKRVVRRKIK